MILIAVASLGLSSCAPFNYTEPDAPKALQQVPRFKTPPKIAIVLGSGGPRGYAHIGVIKVLEEAGIKPDLIVGTSVGALIGSFWASGLSANELDAKSFEGGPLSLFDLNPFADRGWIRGQKLQDYANRSLNDKPIQNLHLPLIITATRKQDKTAVQFMQGNLGVAIRASSAIPGIISPVGIEGVEYEDGDESMPLAVSAAKAAGAQFIIAIDVSAHAGSAPPEASKAWLVRDHARRSRIDPEVANADFLIHPELGYWASPFRSYFEMARRKGEADARALLPNLKAKLKQKFPEMN